MDGYFEWLCSRVGLDLTLYSHLAKALYEKPFEVILPMDMNRYMDGIELRSDYRIETGQPTPEGPCSILEMMIGLAVRCETYIMADDDYGDRTGQWFHEMLLNLGILVDDYDFDPVFTDYILENLNKRTYLPNGLNGGLFRTNQEGVDMRQIEIWYQLHRYLREFERE